ncbi:MAG: TonB-dependent receptor [Saprospirales bacterium]|nr:TonB-dependent receptor [Saprospirales bacterium]
MRPFWLLLSLHFWLGIASGQEPGVDTIDLPEALVLGNRLEAFGPGAAKWVGEPEKDLPGISASLGSALPLVAPVYVKSYGPGQLASLSLRGAGASHTALIWHGFNLQNPMHGQLDLTLVPVHLFSSFHIDPGANGALWGSGAVGGAVHLSSDTPELQSGHALRAGMQTGSFHQNAQNLSWKWGGKSLGLHTQIFRVSQRNDFSFRDHNGDPKKQSHAAFRQLGAMQDLLFRKKNHQLDAHIWVQGSQREIPPTLLQSNSQATQDDRSLRLALHWQYFRNQWAFHLRSAFLYDEIDYRDPAIALADLSRSRVVYAEAETRWSPLRGHLAGFGFHQAVLQGESENYAANPLQLRQAVFGSYRLESPKGKWTGIASLRQEWMKEQLAPIAPALNLLWKPTPLLEAQFQVARHFRWPTQNDLFWSPGGNADLKPEEGWGGELGLSLKKSAPKTSWETGLSAFQRRIGNWILWRPSGSYWSPENLLLVWSRGLEASASLSREFGPVKTEYFAAYAWVKSSSLKPLSPNDRSAGKQLIYTPEHTLTGSAKASWKDFTIAWTQRYGGKVYTLSDHSASLPPYWLSDLQLEYSFNLNDLNILIFNNIFNLFNTSYQAVESRPMPGRWGEIGVFVNLKK